MKGFLTILIVLCIIQPTAYAQSYDASLLDELGDSLVNFSLDPEIGVEVRGVQPRLSFYRQYLTKAFSYRDTIHIDVLLQYHGHYLNNPGDLRLLGESQAVVLKALEQGSYDIIADEGTDVDSVTLTSLFTHVMEKGREMGSDPDSAAIWNAVLDDTLYNGVSYYLKRHPRAYIIGSEEYPMLELSSKLLNLTDAGNRPDPRYDRLSQIALDLRSDIALAKLLTALHRKGYAKGAINIGLMHEQRLAEVLQQHGIPHSLIRTL